LPQRNRPTNVIVTVLGAAGMLADRRAARRLPMAALGVQVAATTGAAWSDDAASRGIFLAHASGNSSSRRDIGQPA